MEYLNENLSLGKEYYFNCKLKFEGEYLFQEKWDGKFYDHNGNILFQLNNGNAIIEENYYKLKIFISENLI